MQVPLLAWTLVGCAGAPLPPDEVLDADGDGVTVAAGDCDDQDPLVAAGRADNSGNEIDEDCDGVDGVDADGDGRASVASGGEDCDDRAPAVLGPDAPDVADDGVDANCDGADGVDRDGDGSPDLASGGTDCDDADPAVFPGQPERCDGVDQNCSGGLDDEAGLLTLSDGTSFRALDAALRRVRAGGTIQICPGRYLAAVEIDADVTLVGVGAREDIVLDGQGRGPVVTVSHGLWIASHLTLSGGSGALRGDGSRVGGGVWISGDDVAVRLSDVVIADNSATEGGGLYTESDAEIVIEDSLLTRNRADVGGAVRVRGVPVDVRRTTFVDNAAWIRGVDLVADPVFDGEGARATQISFEDVEVGRNDPAAGDAPRDAVEVTGGVFTSVGGRFAGIHGTPLLVRPPQGPTPASQLYVTGTVFEDNSGGWAGAIVDAGAAVVEIDDALVQRNRALVGAIWLQANPSVGANATQAALTDLSVLDNVGTQLSGGVVSFDVDLRIERSVFRGNTSTSTTGDGSGGALRATRANGAASMALLHISDSDFSGNTAGAHGGAIAVQDAYELAIATTSFSYNTSTGDGGAIHLDGNGATPTFYMMEASFQHDRAGGHGGAIATIGAFQDIARLLFVDEAAGGDGGAIDARPYQDATRVREGVFMLSEVTFEGCVAAGAGGAVHTTMPSVTVDNFRGVGQRAARGGMFAFDPYSRAGVMVGPIAYIAGGVASDSEAGRGGWMDAVGADLNVVSTEVSTGVADHGGCLHLQAALGEDGRARLSATAEISTSVFTGCVATGGDLAAQGGAIAAMGAQVGVTESTFTGNSAAGGRGGAISVWPVRMADGRIDTRASLTAGRSTFADNEAAEGGAVAVDASVGELDGNWFLDNAATARGGALAVVDDSARPGFIAYDTSHTDFDRNDAPVGGAVFARSVDLRLHEIILRGNTADLGGAVAMEAVALTRVDLQSAVVEGNVATGAGGGLYAETPGDPGLGWLILGQVAFGAGAGENSPDDLAIGGVGSAGRVGIVTRRECFPLDASCL